MRSGITRRLQRVSQQARELAYRRISRLWAAGAASKQEQEELFQTFCWLVTAEAARGTPLEAILSRLPADMTQGLRQALARLLEDSV